MRAPIFYATEVLRRGAWMVNFGVVAVVAILATAAVLLFLNLPDSNAFNAKVEQIFVANDLLRGETEIRLLEILAQSGSAFAEVLVSYRMVIFVLLVCAAALLAVVALCLITIVAQNRRLRAARQAGIEVSALVIARGENTVTLNQHEFALSPAAIETLAVLAEARMDDEVLSGAQIEAMISGRALEDCEEAAGATRIKRLRDALGNQLVSELLVKTVARKGYMLAINKAAIRVD